MKDSKDKSDEEIIEEFLHQNEKELKVAKRRAFIRNLIADIIFFGAIIAVFLLIAYGGFKFIKWCFTPSSNYDAKLTPSSIPAGGVPREEYHKYTYITIGYDDNGKPVRCCELYLRDDEHNNSTWHCAEIEGVLIKNYSDSAMQSCASIVKAWSEK